MLTQIVVVVIGYDILGLVSPVRALEEDVIKTGSSYVYYLRSVVGITHSNYFVASSGL